MMNIKVQAPVMMRPTGKMPSVRPGKTNIPALAAADDAGMPADVDVLTESAKTPLTKDASFDDRTVVMTLPFLSEAERAIRGTRRP